jgi:integrase-like protein
VPSPAALKAELENLFPSPVYYNTTCHCQPSSQHMEQWEYNAWCHYLLTGQRPAVFRGKVNNVKFAGWKRNRKHYQLVDGRLMRKVLVQDVETDSSESNTQLGTKTVHQLRIVITQAELPELLYKLHNAELGGGHDGRDRVLLKVKSNYWFKGMFEVVSDYVAKCEACSATKTSKAKGPLRPIVATQKGERMTMDHTGPYPDDWDTGARYLLLVIDNFTKFAWGEAFATLDVEPCARWVYNLLLQVGVPRLLCADNGGAFVGKVMRQVQEWLGVQAVHGNPRHPRKCTLFCLLSCLA